MKKWISNPLRGKWQISKDKTQTVTRCAGNGKSQMTKLKQAPIDQISNKSQIPDLKFSGLVI